MARTEGDVTSATQYAIDRGSLPGVANGYMGSYLGDLDGFKEAQAAAVKDPTKAPASAASRPPTLDDRLPPVEAVWLVAEQALSLPIELAGPGEVRGAVRRPRTPPPTATPGRRPGPYYSPTTSRVRTSPWIGTRTGSEHRLRPAYLDKVDIQEGFSDTVSAGKKILNGSALANGDFELEPEVTKEAVQNFPDAADADRGGGNGTLALKTTEPPFDDLNSARR